jgi:cyclopropane-fatty-acyl-phospholipid synthase
MWFMEDRGRAGVASNPWRGLWERVVPQLRIPPRTSDAEAVVRELFGLAGIEIGGTAPGDIRVRDARFYERVLRDASVGFGEAYMEDWWEADALDVTIDKICRAHLKEKITGSWRMRALTVKAAVLNLQAKARARDVDGVHARADQRTRGLDR